MIPNSGKIKWFTDPNYDYITLYTVDTQSKNRIQFVGNGDVLDFGSDTWTLAISGYGPQALTIYLSSSNYPNELASVVTNPDLFNYFAEGVFAVTPSKPLNNLNEIRSIDLKIQVPFQGKLYDIPKYLNTPIYWTWQYDDIVDSNLMPITAFEPINGNILYKYGTSTNYSLVSTITIKVKPDVDYTPKLHNVTIFANSDVKYPPVTGSYTFNVDAFPDKSILNADFKTYYYNNSSVIIGDTYEGLNTITRPATGDMNFLLVDNKKLLSKIVYDKLTWVLNDTRSLKSFSDSLNIDSNVLGLSSYKITLKIDSAIAPGWTSAHNVSSSEYFYAIDPIIFFKPLEFILYPEYAWINSPTLTFLDKDNYTLSYRPSAYGNKRSNSQAFWLSANKDYYTEYKYTNTNTGYFSALSSSFELMEVLYDPLDVSIYTGIPISLECYNNTTYPEIMGTTYYAISNNVLQQFQFTNYFLTLNYDPNLGSDFRMSPTIEPYNDISLKYQILTPIIDLDVNGNVTISQNLTTVPENAPAINIGGSIIYSLSSYFWTLSTGVQPVDGQYNIFHIYYGDPVVPSYSGQDGVETYYLSVSTNIIQQIPPTTFPTGSSDHTGQTDLWYSITI